MTLTQLRYFVAIVDAGLNITLAAERVHATQPGLSKQIKQLEEELGVLLFNRGGRSLDALTPAGREILERARRMLAEAENIRAYAANQRGEVDGSLTVVTTHTQARYVLPAAVAGLKQAFPRLSLHLEPAGDAEVMDRLTRGEADLALLSSVGAPPEGGQAVPLFRWRRVVLVPREHPLASEGAPDMASLARHPLVSYESSLRPESSLRRAFEAAGLVPEFAVTARDADLIKTYVRAGLGVGILAEMAITADDDQDLVVLRAPPELPECTAWAVLPPQRVARDYTLDLLLRLAPWIDRHDLRRTLTGAQEARWAVPPRWREGL
jgi:LysR family cys regulon transcriptional activator